MQFQKFVFFEFKEWLTTFWVQVSASLGVAYIFSILKEAPYFFLKANSFGKPFDYAFSMNMVSQMLFGLFYFKSPKQEKYLRKGWFLLFSIIGGGIIQIYKFFIFKLSSLDSLLSLIQICFANYLFQVFSDFSKKNAILEVSTIYLLTNSLSQLFDGIFSKTFFIKTFFYKQNWFYFENNSLFFFLLTGTLCYFLVRWSMCSNQLKATFTHNRRRTHFFETPFLISPLLPSIVISQLTHLSQSIGLTWIYSINSQGISSGILSYILPLGKNIFQGSVFKTLKFAGISFGLSFSVMFCLSYIFLQIDEFGPVKKALFFKKNKLALPGKGNSLSQLIQKLQKKDLVYLLISTAYFSGICLICNFIGSFNAIDGFTLFLISSQLSQVAGAIISHKFIPKNVKQFLLKS